MVEPRRTVILGAAGRDFHNFNVLYRDGPGHRVVAFTATQIPDIAGRTHPPPSLAGERYPDGIPIVDEAEREADVILWDGGNNDLPFYAPQPGDRPRRSAPCRRRDPLPPGRGQRLHVRHRHRGQVRLRVR
uniref:hypothetical protein n=1 Tax=Tessaracoccus timonensis TaxID=2161816 RepID=UPI0018D54835|nr:hypothetical protein [Tessaracoccus timonensis]